MLWYSLEEPYRDTSNKYNQHMFLCRNKKNINIFLFEIITLHGSMTSFLLGRRKLIIRFSSPPAPKKLDQIKKLRWKTFPETTGFMPKTDFITLLRIANELFAMKRVLKQGFLVFALDS